MKHRTAHSVLHHAHLHRRADAQVPTPATLTVKEPMSIVKRADAVYTCGADKKSQCTMPVDVGGSGTLTIALAAAIPITLAIVVLFLLHRRIKRKTRMEDANDKHKSLDFGLDVVDSGHSKKGRNGKKEKPEMTIHTAPAGMRRDRGLSMDLDLTNPYLLPAGVNGSRDSLHSMSRGLSDPNDPYRPVTFVNSETDSYRSASRLRNETSSLHTAGGYSQRSGSLHKASLLQNASHMPHDSYNNTPDMHSEKYASFDEPRNQPRPPRKQSLANSGKQDRWYPSDDPKYGSDSPPDLAGMAPQQPQDMLSDRAAIPAFPQPARHTQPSPVREYDEKRPFLSETNEPLSPHYEDALRITVPSPTHNRQSPPRSPNPLPAPPVEPQHHQEPQDHHDDFGNPPPPISKHNSDPQDGHLNLPGNDTRRVSVMGLRPLPPDDPSDDPEARANRIRSFYREYFDDSKPNPVGHYPPMPPVHDPYGHGPEDDYHADYLDDGAVYDPETGAFYTNPHQVQHHSPRPFAEPMGRRAMTPPPRAPGHFMRGHRSAMSTQSAGRARPPPKKQLPPPKPLQSLPTPHLLREDSSLFDFAPPTTFRDRQIGRAPDSPLGSQRPYSPAFRAHTPLGASFDELAPMPSPHALRKSGTFTALDFAPPPRFRDRAESFSDAGSVRSNRSGISAVHQNAIRAGAYRISRLPTDQVGTAQDINNSLKPKWDIGR
ncbi:hypothetical protein CAC42_2615 [Sphaceloma murrayae]|uniref:Uncharacterized protein n=1 Tax=Sphaceloma murrayae TaxID=2082308 RepID=A0A2K1QHD6_9PEZI|nr:hypothetical protein CAC42_2615 [Sphaceloma murrayae]